MNKYENKEFLSMKISRLRDGRSMAGIAQNSAWSKLGLTSLGDLRAYEFGMETPDEALYLKMSKLYGKSVSWLKGGDE